MQLKTQRMKASGIGCVHVCVDKGLVWYKVLTRLTLVCTDTNSEVSEVECERGVFTSTAAKKYTGEDFEKKEMCSFIFRDIKNRELFGFNQNHEHLVHVVWLIHAALMLCVCHIVWLLLCADTDVLRAAEVFGADEGMTEYLPSIPLLIKQAHNGNYGKTARANLESNGFAAQVGLALVNESEMTRLKR